MQVCLFLLSICNILQKNRKETIYKTLANRQKAASQYKVIKRIVRYSKFTNNKAMEHAAILVHFQMYKTAIIFLCCNVRYWLNLYFEKQRF